MSKYKILLTALFILAAGQLFSQNVGINTYVPDASAALEIKSTDKGLLIPRVNLISVTDNITIPFPATSLLVYNINAFLSKGSGYYFNAGTSASPSWESL